MKRYELVHDDAGVPTSGMELAQDGKWAQWEDVERHILSLPQGSEAKAAINRCVRLEERVRELEALVAGLHQERDTITVELFEQRCTPAERDVLEVLKRRRIVMCPLCKGKGSGPGLCRALCKQCQGQGLCVDDGKAELARREKAGSE